VWGGWVPQARISTNPIYFACVGRVSFPTGARALALEEVAMPNKVWGGGGGRDSALDFSKAEGLQAQEKTKTNLTN
jgi:hypothetical protein